MASCSSCPPAVIRRRLWAVAAIVVVGLSACTAVGSEFVALSPVGPSNEQPAGAPLARPRVAPLDPDRPRYDREQWQPRGSADEDGDSCNTREEVLLFLRSHLGAPADNMQVTGSSASAAAIAHVSLEQGGR